MKKFLSYVCGVLCFVLLCSLSGCGGKVIQSYDKDKVQLFVQTYDGGFGQEWMNDVKERFEAKYADYTLGDKKGVEVVIDPRIEIGNELPAKIQVTKNEIFFTEICNYFNLKNEGILLDVTDVLTEKLTEYGESKSIAEKLPDNLRNYYGLEENGSIHYYGLTYANAFSGFVYDEDLFYQNGFYYKRPSSSESTIKDRLIRPITADQKNTAGNYAELVMEDGQNYYKTVLGDYLSTGPDGKYGTSDDGQPATYADMFALCDYMIDPNGDGNMSDALVTSPFMWLGKNNAGYLGWMFSQLVADYEGAEQMQLHFSFDGVAKNLITVDDSGKITELPDLELEPGKELEMYQSAGIYYAAKFFEKIYSNDYYANPFYCQSGSNDHLTAQDRFINSIASDKKFAFLFDGIWWQHEAEDAFATMEEKDSAYAKKNRNFKLLSMPKATPDKVGEGATYADTNYTLAFIRKDIGEKEEIAKKFLQFCFTEESNRKFNQITGVPRDLDYELTQEEYQSLDAFSQSVYDLVKNGSEGGGVVYPFSNNAFFKRKSQSLISWSSMYKAYIDGTKYDNLLEMFRTKHFTAEQVFHGVYARVLQDIGK